jgi:pimeloyl-ACP methyl ester carboxylesterase
MQATRPAIDSVTPDIRLLDDPHARLSAMTAMVAGRGSDVVLVLGALGDYRQWELVAEPLQARHRVVALSRRYHWPNAPPASDAQYSYEGHRDDLLQYVRATRGAVHLVGHSYGAGVAMLAAIAEPQAFRTLTLIEPALHSLLPADAFDRRGGSSGPPGDLHEESISCSGGPSGPREDLREELSSRAAMRAEVLRLAQQGDDAAAARLMIDWTQGGPGGFGSLPSDAQRVLLQNALTVGPTFSQAAPDVRAQQLAALTMPILVMRGERTRLYYRLITDTVASARPNARTAEIAGAGHMSIVERPREVAEVLRSFLERKK